MIWFKFLHVLIQRSTAPLVSADIVIFYPLWHSLWIRGWNSNLDCQKSGLLCPCEIFLSGANCTWLSVLPVRMCMNDPCFRVQSICAATHLCYIDVQLFHFGFKLQVISVTPHDQALYQSVHMSVDRHGYKLQCRWCTVKVNVPLKCLIVLFCVCCFPGRHRLRHTRGTTPRCCW